MANEHLFIIIVRLKFLVDTDIPLILRLACQIAFVCGRLKVTDHYQFCYMRPCSFSHRQQLKTRVIEKLLYPICPFSCALLCDSKEIIRWPVN